VKLQLHLPTGTKKKSSKIINES